MKIKNLLKPENWWIIILGSIITWMVYIIFSNPEYNKAFNFIIPGLKLTFLSTIAKNILGEQTERRLYVEGIAGLQKKADKSGMPYNILKQVYDRGMAAWKSGHRPGASQQQWAFARVNSFITKSSGTWGGADKDLAAKVKGSK